MSDHADKEHMTSRGGPVFQVGDRVRKRFTFGEGKGDFPPTGTVVAINGRWINVKHDRGDGKYSRGVPDRFDYLSEELEHLNPLLRLASEL